MKDWKKFWQSYRVNNIKTQEDLLYQVGKTVKGKVISKEQMELDVLEISKNLRLCKNDILLDLCCGNGVISFQLSKYVEKVIGLDFSKIYISNAKKHSNNFNIEYFDINILNQFELNEKLKKYNITKVLMNDCLAYFNPNTFNQILSTLSSYNVEIVCSSVLDNKRKWNFYNTFKRKFNYFLDVLIFNNKSGIGFWWEKSQIKKIAKKNDFFCEFYNHHSLNYTAHYRFNVKFKKI